MTKAFRLQLLAAFAAIYVIWGSTYLAIVFAIETMPPLLMLGARFGVAGLIVYAWARAKGIATPTRTEWKNAALVGTMTLAAGTGAVAWAEQWVPSGVAALLVTTVPIWMVLLEWQWKRGPMPARTVWLGLGIGVAGILLLVNPAELSGGDTGMLYGSIAILLASMVFSAGAILGRDRELPPRPLMSTAAQMLTGGASLTLAGLLRGEWAAVDVAAITTESWLAWAYLMVFGSIIAYGSFVWLMKNASPARVSTYAYVNPVVAVILGWLLGGEELGGRVLMAMVLLLSAVLLITRFGGGRRRPGGRTARIARVLVNRGGAILSAFAHSMDAPARSMPRLRDSLVALEQVPLRPGVRAGGRLPERAFEVAEIAGAVLRPRVEHGRDADGESASHVR
ncbi:MAG: EamA family transporter [Rhodothermales bacterium]|nr:EamA family transporter [Rhodothermales bacterium]MBO6781515.1 EamA family transporter [Rhodothermales bacterium]